MNNITTPKPVTITNQNYNEEEVLEKLSNLSQNEKYMKLGKVLNYAQRQKYMSLDQNEEYLLEKINSTFDEKELKKLNQQLNKISNEKLRYEKLIYNPKPKNPIPKINKSDYKIDNQGIGYDIDKSVLEKKQINTQKNIHFTVEEQTDISDYLGGNHYKINGYLHSKSDTNLFYEHQKDYQNELNTFTDEKKKSFINEIKQIVLNIDSAMAKTTGLTQKTTLYRSGQIDIDLNEGDIGMWDTITSTSFQKRAAEGYADESRYEITILADKGQKGIAANDSTFASWTHEHEFTLPRGQKYQVIEVDHRKKTATVLLIN